MKRWLILAVAVLGFMTSDLQAAHPPRHGLFFRTRPLLRRHTPSPAQYQKEMHARYPKYVGGFHYSYFRDIGVPPGDIGPRGNGFQALPW